MSQKLVCQVVQVCVSFLGVSNSSFSSFVAKVPFSKFLVNACAVVGGCIATLGFDRGHQPFSNAQVQALKDLFADRSFGVFVELHPG